MCLGAVPVSSFLVSTMPEVSLGTQRLQSGCPINSKPLAIERVQEASWLFPQAAGAGVTEYGGLGGLNNTHFFTVVEGRSQNQGAIMVRFPEGLSSWLVDGRLLAVFSHGGEKEQALWHVSRPGGPILMTFCSPT